MKMKSFFFAILMIAMGFTMHIHASGFAIAEQSVAGLGNAFSGGAAVAEDASTVWYNPAGMSKLCHHNLNMGTHWIIPTATFKNKGSLRATDKLFVELDGDNGADAGENSIVPNFYFTKQLGCRLWAGFGLNVPFGLVTKYDASWVGRFHAIDSRLITMNMNPAIAYQVNDWISIGAGVSAQYAHAFLTNAIDAGLLSQGGVICEPYVELTGENWGYGYNAGILFDLWCNSRLGIHYRSEIDHGIRGKVRFLGTQLLQESPLFLVNAKARSNVRFPQLFSISLYAPFWDCYEFLFDASWTKWNVFKKLVFKFSSDQPDSRTKIGWENIWRISAGLNYNWNECLKLRVGFAYDESPVPNKELATIRIPDADRYWAAFGASYYWNQCLRFDAGYTHIFADDGKIDMTPVTDITDPNFFRGFIKGKWDLHADILSIQATVIF